MRIRILLLGGLLVLALLSSCRSTSMVSPLSPLSVLPEPPATSEPEPEPTATAEPEPLTPLLFDEPLYEGDEEVSGTGPAGLPIIIMDASLQINLGSGTVDPDGTFRIAVDPPLVAPNLLGIMLDETRSSPYPKEWIPCLDRCRDQPMVGLLYDRAPVKRP